MKKSSALSKINSVLCVVLVIAIIATVYVVNKYPDMTVVADTSTSDDADTSVLETSFVEGTYGGVEFNSFEDVANYYVEAYNYTKSLTAEYTTDDGSTATFYKLLGDESLEIGDVYIDGKSNSIVNGIVPGIVSGLMSYNTYGLVPCFNRNPDLDNNSEDAAKTEDLDFKTSHVTADDILDANIVDNGDGYITMTIQPKAAEMSIRGMDSQGRFFEVLGDISATVAQIDQVTFTEGTAEDNVNVTYKGGTVVVKIDTATKEIVEADYTMYAYVSVTHASITVIKDKSAELLITYTNHYPASDEYLLETKGLVRQ